MNEGKLLVNNLNKSRIHIKVRGVVQGVGFRFACLDQARRLGLRGWVRNCSDGSVELLAEGPAAELECLARWCGQGPPGAVVRDCQLQPPAGGALKDFEILPTV